MKHKSCKNLIIFIILVAFLPQILALGHAKNTALNALAYRAIYTNGQCISAKLMDPYRSAPFYVDQANEVRWDKINQYGFYFYKKSFITYRPYNNFYLKLKPNESVILAVPSLRAVRIVFLRNMHSNELSILNANVLGLWKAVKYTRHWHEIDIPPERQQASWLLIKNKSKHNTVAMSVFVSRLKSISSGRAFRKVMIPFSIHKKITHKYTIETFPKMFSLRPYETRHSQRFWKINSNSPYETQVKGPILLRISMRKPTSQMESGVGRTFWLNTTLDRKPYKTLMLNLRNIDTRMYYYSNSPLSAIYLQPYFIFIPAGVHILAIHSRIPIYLSVSNATYRLLLYKIFQYPFFSALKPTYYHNAFCAANKLILQQRARENLSYQIYSQSPTSVNTWWFYLMKIIFEKSPFSENDLSFFRTMSRLNSYYQTLSPEIKRKHLKYKTVYPDLQISQLYNQDRASRLILGSYARLLAESNRPVIMNQISARWKNSLIYRIPNEIKGPIQVRILLSSIPNLNLPIKLTVISNRTMPKHIVYTGIINNKTLVKRWTAEELGHQISALDHKNSPLFPLILSSMDNYLFPYRKVADLKLTFPPGTQWIKIIPHKMSVMNAYIALQVLRTRPHQLSEDEYLTVTKSTSLSQRHRWFFSLISKTRNHTRVSFNSFNADHTYSFTQLNHYQLENEWRNLVAYLQSLKANMAINVGPKLVKRIGPEESETVLLEQAKQYQENGELLRSLRYWSKLVLSNNKKIKREAVLQQQYILFKLNEPVIAARLARYHYYYSTDPRLRRRLYIELIKLYKKLNDTNKIGTLLGVQLLRDPSALSMRQLGWLLMNKGNFRWALDLALLLPNSSQNRQLLLTASYRQGWWKVFNATLKKGTTKENKLWKGYRLQLYGHDKAAVTSWQSAGSKGRSLIKLLIQGKNIANQIAFKKRITSQVIINWKSWENQQVGPKYWKFAPWLVADYAKVRQLISLGGFSSRIFEATSHQPVVLTVYGPSVIRLDLRRLITPQTSAAVDNWASVRVDRKQILWPLVSLSPSILIHFSSYINAKVGRQLPLVLHLTPGLHTIKIASNQGSVLVRPLVQRAILPLNVLPIFTKEALSASHYPSMVKHSQSGTTLAPTFIFTEKGSFINANKVLRSFRARLSQSIEYINNMIKKYKHITTTFYHHHSSHFSDHSDATAISKMTHLMNIATSTKDPKRKLDAIAKAELLYVKHKNVEGIRNVWAILLKMAVWNSVPNIDSPAGVYSQAINGWNPESKQMNLTAALSGLTHNYQQLLSSGNRVEFLLTKKSDSKIHVHLELQEPTGLTALTSIVAYRMNKKPIKYINISPKNPKQELILDIPAGSHVVSFWLERPIQGQFVSIFIEGQYIEPESMFRTSIRNYYITTKAQPVSVHVKGPTLLRIIKKYNKKQDIVYRYVPSGYRIIKIYPIGERTLLRIFQKILVEPLETRQRIPEALQKTKTLQTNVVNNPNKLWRITQKSRYFNYNLYNELPLGSQQSGTWNIYGGYNSRFDKADTILDIERYYEVGSGYFYHDLNRDIYYYGNFVLHFPINELPVMGGIGLITGKWMPTSKTPPFTWWASGKLFTQRVPVKPNKPWEAGGEWDLNLGQHRTIMQWLNHFPQINIFAKYLSLKNLPLNILNDIDQDVYTDYDNNYRYGVKLSDIFTVWPWWNGKLQFVIRGYFGFFKTDSVRYAIRIQQKIAALHFQLEYEKFFFLKNRDRDVTNQVKRVYLDIWLNKWFHSQQRLQFHFRFGADPRIEDKVIALELVWLGGTGRAMTDISREYAGFNSLNQRIAPVYNLSGNYYGSQ